MKMLNLAWHSADEFDNDGDKDKPQNIVIITVACMFLLSQGVGTVNSGIKDYVGW